MARPLRIEYANAWYHVMNRGLEKRAVFKTDDHRGYFLSLLADTAERFAAEWHAYCLLGNHYHLMLRTPEGNLQRIMRHLNGVYTQYFNRMENRDGPLFRGRYKAILVDADSYWLNLSRYIHRNPLEAGMVTRLGDYPWSSYPAYIGKRKPPDWLQTGYVLGAVSQSNQQRRYRQYVELEDDQELVEFYERERSSPILGSESFRDEHRRPSGTDREVPELSVIQRAPAMGQIIEAVAAQFNVEAATLVQSQPGRRHLNVPRMVAMLLAQQKGRYSLQAIAGQFGLNHYASAASSIRNLKQRMKSDRVLKRQVDRIGEALNHLFTECKT